MGVTELTIKLKALKAEIKGVFNGLYFCCGSLSAHKNDENVLTNDEAIRSCANFTFSRSIYPVEHLLFLWKQGFCSNLIVIAFFQLVSWRETFQ